MTPEQIAKLKVKVFEDLALNEVGDERKKLRKAPPKLPLYLRLELA
jgi:hypothetical protein